jgi:8-oxo-dGTP diphosphatase
VDTNQGFQLTRQGVSGDSLPHTYEYPRPALAVDCAVFAVEDDALKVLLIRRGQSPFQGQWSLPGGFVHMTETTDEAARRELLEETGLSHVFLEQLYTFSDVDRDPRERVVSVAHFALVRSAALHAGSDATEASWFEVSAVPALAFDHRHILHSALERLRGKVRYQPLGFELLPAKFTLGQLQRLYENILGRPLDKRNFRRAFLRMSILEELEELEEDVSHRPSRLYRFNKAEYKRLVKAGFNFEI